MSNSNIDEVLDRSGFDARMMLVFIFQMVFLGGFIVVGLDLIWNVEAVLAGGADILDWRLGVFMMVYAVGAYFIAKWTGDLDSMSANANTDDK